MTGLASALLLILVLAVGDLVPPTPATDAPPACPASSAKAAEVDALYAEMDAALAAGAFERLDQAASRFIPTIRAVCGGASEDGAQILVEGGLHFRDAARHALSETFFRAAVEMLSARGGRPDEPLASTTLFVAESLRAQDRTNEAIVWLRRAVVLYDRAVGSRDPGTLIASQQLGILLVQSGALQEGEAQLKSVLDHSDLLAPEVVAFAQTGLAESLRRQGPGRAAEAIEASRQALESRRRIRPPADPMTLQTAMGLAEVLAAQQDLKGAEAELRRVLEAAPDHAGAIADLSDIAQARGESAEALRLASRGLELELPLRPRSQVAVKLYITRAQALLHLHLAQVRNPFQAGAGHLEEARRSAGAAIEILETDFPSDEKLSRALNEAAQIAIPQKRFTEAEGLARRALGVAPPGSDISALNASLGSALMNQGRWTEAEALLKAALEHDIAQLGWKSPSMRSNLMNIAAALRAFGKPEEAEALYARMAANLPSPAAGAAHDDFAFSLLLARGGNLDASGQHVAAEVIYRDLLATVALDPDLTIRAYGYHELGVNLMAQGQSSEALALQKAAYDIWRVHGSTNQTATAGGNYAHSLIHDGRPELARAVLTEVLPLSAPGTAARRTILQGLAFTAGADADRRAAWDRLLLEFPGERQTNLTNLALWHEAFGRDAEAERLYIEAIDTDAQRDWPLQAADFAGYAEFLLKRGRTDEAVENARRLHAQKLEQDEARAAGPSRRLADRAWPRHASLLLAKALWRQHAATSSRDQAPQRRAEAFAAVQSAFEGAAAHAVLEAAARRSAADAGVRSEVDALTRLERRRASIQARQRQVLAQGGDVEPMIVANLNAELRAVEQARGVATARIGQVFPDYWRMRDPARVTEEQLRGGPDKGSSLLGEREAFVQIAYLGDDAPALVFAYSRGAAAWSASRSSGADLRAKILEIRRAIDPQAYDGGPAPKGQGPGPFPRQVAHQLFTDLFGDPEIRAIMLSRDIDTLLIAPSGPFVSLPFSVLITEDPGPGPPTSDPAVLRAAPWLLKAKAISTLPGISTLAALRAPVPQAEDNRSTPLVAFADPDYGTPAARQVETRHAELPPEVFRDGVGDLNLPSLNGMGALEARRIQRLLGGIVLTGRRASEAEVRRLDAKGDLSRTKVIAFAAHAVAPPRLGGREPALALSITRLPASSSSGDGLLTVTEIADLRLAADWVVLSACNTAAPDLEESEGVSGLSRAFLAAGARSVMVSHWRVGNQLAPILVPKIVELHRDNPDWTRAQALQKAAMWVLASPDVSGGFQPYAWAAFALVGDGR